MKKLVVQIKKQKFLVVSIIIHIIIFMIFHNYNLFNKVYQKPLKYLEITEISSPDSNKIPNNSKRVAKNSNKVVEEKIKKAPIKSNNRKDINSKKSERIKKELSDKKKDIKEFGDLEAIKKEKDKKSNRESVQSEERIFSYGMTDPESNDEATVDFNTKEFKYISYFLRIKRKIEMTWSYPKSSLQRGETGQVSLRVTLDKIGRLKDIEIIKSSGFIELDEEAKSAVLSASPFGPFPSSWTLKKLSININFNYTPKGWYY